MYRRSNATSSPRRVANSNSRSASSDWSSRSSACFRSSSSSSGVRCAAAFACVEESGRLGSSVMSVPRWRCMPKWRAAAAATEPRYDSGDLARDGRERRRYTLVRSEDARLLTLRPAIYTACTSRSNKLTPEEKMKPLASKLNQGLPSVYRRGESTTRKRRPQAECGF